MRDPLKYNGQTALKNSSLLVGWTGDAGKLGESVVDFIIKKLEGHVFFEIDPEEYFPLGGVTIEDDLVQFPESKFYVCPSYNLVVFKSAPPTFEVYKFFNHVLDIAQRLCKTTEIYALGGMVTTSLHTIPRHLLGVFSTDDVKESLSSYDIDGDSDYETPPGQKPTLNSFLLWAAKRRNLPAAGLWILVPFYFMSLDDPKAQKKILEFLNARFGLEINLDEFDQAILKQNRKINEARDLFPELDNYFQRLESSLTLSEDDNLKLVKQIEEYLKEDLR